MKEKTTFLYNYNSLQTDSSDAVIKRKAEKCQKRNVNTHIFCDF